MAKRAVYIVNSTQTIRYAWDAEDAYENPDLVAIYETLKTIDELNFDRRVSPATESE